MILVSKYRSLETQGLLFDSPLGNHGHCRTVIGELGEELTARLVNGRRHKTQGNVDYCPDVSRMIDDEVHYYESKVCGLSGQTFVYGGRLAKDREFAKQHRLWYVVWRHRAATKDAGTVAELRELVLSRMTAVFVVPFTEIDLICQGLAEEPLNSNYGHSKDRAELYGSGYRIPVKLLYPWSVPLPEGVGKVEGFLYS